MKEVLKAISAILVLSAFLLFPGDSVSSQVSKKRVLPKASSPLKVSGLCSIAIRPYDTLLTAQITLNALGNPVIKQKVSVDGKPVPEYQPGRYRETFKGYKAVPGKLIQLSIEPPRGISRVNPPLAKPTSVLATAQVKVPMRFITPRPNARVRILPHRKLTISWNPGTGVGPMQCYIYEFTGPSQLAANPTYANESLSTGSVVVSTAKFKPNKKYGIYIYRKLGNFSFKVRVAAGSRMSLSHTVGTYIFTR